MKLLAVDRGNTNTKLGVFVDSSLKEVTSLKDEEIGEGLNRLINQFEVEEAVLSSVRNDSFEIEAFTTRPLNVFRPDSNSIFPFKIEYSNKQNIGFDRLANTCGAIKRNPDKNSLVVDCGTCITYSLLEKGIFKGGAIAPGITMRFKALNHFTGRLPLVERTDKLKEVPAQSTENSIHLGVELAIILETDALIAEFCNKTPDLNVLLTGGSMVFFEQHLKSATFAAPYLTLEGLHEIFTLNK